MPLRRLVLGSVEQSASAGPPACALWRRAATPIIRVRDGFRRRSPRGASGEGVDGVSTHPTPTHYSLLTTHYSLLTTHYSLLTIHYSLFTIRYSPPHTGTRTAARKPPS